MRFTTPQFNPTPRSLFSGGMAVAAALVSLVTMVSCKPAEKLDLTDAGKKGHNLYMQSGCASCHGTTGRGGAGPALAGLYGTQVELKDGTTVIADETYLTTAISDPEAQKVAGYSVTMPKRNDLSADQISEIVEFIKEIGPAAATGSESGSDAPTS